MARLEPVVEASNYNGIEGFRLKLNPVVLIIGEEGETSILMDLLYTLFSTPPRFGEWVDRVRTSRELDADEFIDLLRDFIDKFPSLTSINMPTRLKGLRDDTLIRLRGPSATLIYRDHWIGEWEDFDWKILDYIRIVRYGETYGVYISNRLFSLFNRRVKDMVISSVISIAGYLIAYMLGPFHLGYRSVLYIPNPINHSEVSIHARNRLYELLGGGREDTGLGEGVKPADLPNILSRINRKIPVLMIHDQSIIQGMDLGELLGLLSRFSSHLLIGFSHINYQNIEKMLRDLYIARRIPPYTIFRLSR